jgi:hypothetical protein
VRTIDRAEALVAAGARQVLVSSALFAKGRIDHAVARALAGAIGIDAVVGMAVYTGALSLDDSALQPPALPQGMPRA